MRQFFCLDRNIRRGRIESKWHHWSRCSALYRSGRRIKQWQRRRCFDLHISNFSEKMLESRTNRFQRNQLDSLKLATVSDRLFDFYDCLASADFRFPPLRSVGVRGTTFLCQVSELESENREIFPKRRRFFRHENRSSVNGTASERSGVVGTRTRLVARREIVCGLK